MYQISVISTKIGNMLRGDDKDKPTYKQKNRKFTVNANQSLDLKKF